MSYSTLTDLVHLGASAAALSPVATDVQQAALDAAKDRVDSYLRAQYKLPLIGTVGNDIKSAECRIAALDLMMTRGYSLEGSDGEYRSRYEDAIRWLEQVAQGTAVPNITDSSPGASAGVKSPGARAISSSPRGFSNRGGNPSGGGGFIGD